MKRTLFAAALAVAGFVLPAQATPTMKELFSTITASGTTIAVDDPQMCKDPELMGRYTYQRDVIDQLTICMANHQGDDDELYDTILHESVHIAQLCKGGPLFKPESIYRVALATEVDTINKHYPRSQAYIELEARVIARDQDEVFVTNLIKEHCK
jgi:hypothetical protein